MPVTAVSAASGSGGVVDDAKLAVWKEALYERCREAFPENDMFSQDDLLRLDVVPNRDLMLLAKVVQSLSNDKLLITMREASGQVLWKWRDAQEAHKYKQCSTDEQVMVYSLIDDSGGDGIWSQTLQKRLNMHDSVLKNALKQLQAKGLIAPFKNVEHPNKKMFIKASIRPSDRATGGPWYTDQNLDEAFIEELLRVVFDLVKQSSGYRSRHGGAPARSQVPKKGVVKGGTTPDKGKKRGATEMSKSPAKAAKTSLGASTTTTPKKEAAMLPLPAGFTGYLTVRDIARLLSNSGITNNTILTESDVKKLVDVLVWDNLIEPIKIAGKVGYRVSRVAKQSTESWAGREDPTGRDGGPEPYISPYTEAPCGKCPVFDLCEEGGPVGPSNCEYFKRWLGKDLD
ncbi:DNA-directed RNA polymerase III subunit RPC6 [Moelleriella libera RCEF 2490]|uniref:DNA-directed RNA polymerase III subunit RPC6 n=1 Tax=Moelleriella libera RCEF 2490 TaxID=1081109 RepID=A0A167X4L0_9HYPO|nr:DNA-directed RNA polymerase III subunit RPC6 [Moelleriella libera RCEF 2490]